MGFREEDNNLIKILVEETYNQSSGEEGDLTNFASYFEDSKESSFIDSFLISREIPFYSGENYDHFFRLNIADRTIDLPKNITLFRYEHIGIISLNKSDDSDDLIGVLSTLDSNISDAQSMLIYMNGKKSRTVFFRNESDFEETVEYLKELSGHGDRINIAA